MFGTKYKKVRWPYSKFQHKNLTNFEVYKLHKQKIILLGFITTPTYLHIPRPTYYLLNFQNLHPVDTKLKWVGSQWDNWIANDVYNPLETVICQIYIWNIDHSHSNDIIGMYLFCLVKCWIQILQQMTLVDLVVWLHIHRPIHICQKKRYDTSVIFCLVSKITIDLYIFVHKKTPPKMLKKYPAIHKCALSFLWYFDMYIWPQIDPFNPNWHKLWK